MAAAGATNLSKLKRAQILAEKKALSVTASELARKHSVSRRTVFRIANENDPEVLEMAESYKAKLREKAERNVTYGLDRMYKLMSDKKSKLSEVTNATKASFEMMRLENGESTQNVVNGSPLESFVTLALGKYGMERTELARILTNHPGLRSYYSEAELAKRANRLLTEENDPSSE